MREKLRENDEYAEETIRMWDKADLCLAAQTFQQIHPQPALGIIAKHLGPSRRLVHFSKTDPPVRESGLGAHCRGHRKTNC